MSQAWGVLNASASRERRFFIKVETVPGDETGDVCIRSHDDISITTTGVVLDAKPKSHPKIRTQTLNPDEGRATIGTMTFDAIDVDQSLTDEMRAALLTNDVGWRLKRVRYYSGFRGLDTDDYELEDTQLIDRVTYSRGVYQFRCRDIQREMRKKIFEPLIARLAQPLSATATTIEIAVDPGFEAVSHGTSYSDGPSTSYLYVQIDDEIIRVPEAGIGATQLTNCTRGVLGTRAAAHTTDENASATRAKEIREVIYLELPVPKLVYALLTGNLIGQVGTLPAHWHLGIDAGDYVRLADFTDVGDDLYDSSDDTKGMIERYILTDSEDGKTFIEKEILRKYGLFMPIYADGSIGLRRGQPVLSGSSVVGVLDDSNIVEEITLTYAMDRVVNDFRIGWNEIDGEPSRYLDIVDTDSVTKWGTAPRLDMVARGLVGSRQTDSRVRDIFEGLRDRYSGPPLTCEVTVFSSQSLYEIGDVIRLRTSTVRDFTNSETTYLDRAFEIQGITKDLAAGTVTYQLFGSSQPAGALPPLESTAALAAGFYTATGSNIASMSGVIDTGTELQLPDGITFTGAATTSGAVYYATKDVRLPSGRTAYYTQNVQLRIRGTLQIDGTFDGSGRGLAGVADTVDVSGIPAFGDVVGPITFATQAGTPGYFGRTQAAGALIERVRGRTDSSSYYRVRIQSVPATITAGRVESIPSLRLSVNTAGTAITGVPSDLRGTSGGPGGVRHFEDSEVGSVNTNRGGTGGAGGAGLLIICRGMVFGASGRIDSSGANGSAGVRNGADQEPAWSGGGAGGAPGATLILLDGSSSSSPVLSSGSIIADYGTTPEPGTPNNYLPDPWIENQNTRFGPSTVTGAFVPDDRVSYYRSSSSGLQAGIAAARFFFLLPPVDPEEDVDDVTLAGMQDIGISITEAFDGVDDTQLTTLLIEVTEVDTTAAYSHAAIYTRRITGPLAEPTFTYHGGADPDLRIILPADGETYIIRAVPVLINGVEAFSGVEEEQIVSEPGLGGPQLGENVYDEDGNLLTDMDVRNDNLAPAQFLAVNANPNFTIPRRHANGQIVPASWFGWGSAAWAQYVDPATRQELRFPSTAGLNYANAAFRIEPGTTYEITLMARKTVSGDVSTLRVIMRERDSELSSGQRAISNGAYSGGSAEDPTSIFAGQTRSIVVNSGQGLTTTHQVFSYTYTPTSTAKWASLCLDAENNSGATGDIRCEWAVVRSNATRNSAEESLEFLADGSYAFGAQTHPALQVAAFQCDAVYAAPSNVPARVTVTWAGQARISTGTSGTAPGESYIRCAVYDTTGSPSLLFEQELSIEVYNVESRGWGSIMGSRTFELDPGQEITVYVQSYREFSGSGLSPAQTHYWRGVSLNLQAWIAG